MSANAGGWSATELEGARSTVSYDVTFSKIGDQRIDYDSPEGAFPQYHIHATVSFFGKTTRKVEEVVGLTEAGAKAMCNDTDASYANYSTATKSVVSNFNATIQYESSSKTTTMRKVDKSGQYAVTVTTTTTEVS